MRSAAIVLGLGMMITPHVLAQSDGDKPKGGDQSSGQHKTIEGVVAGVTVLGETMVDYHSGRAITAERDYLTIVATSGRGKEGGHSAEGEQASSGEKKSDGKQDKDVKQTSGSSEGSKESGDSHEQASKRSARVYLVEVTPSTEVCECQKDGKKKCDLAKLELGDRVEIEFRPANASQGQAQNQAANLRHGRQRMMRGQAVAISILQDDSEQGKDSGSSEHSEKKDSQGAQK